MASTKCKTKHKPEKTLVGEEVLDLVLSYIHNVDDRNSVSLVSRKLYEIDGIMRKSLTVHTHYYPNPSRLSIRFPFIETLTLKGPPSDVTRTYHNNILSPWIEQLALDFRYMKELHMCHLVVHDEDLETLAKTRGKDLRSLKIRKCEGFSTDGLRHVAKYCNQLRTLCLRYPNYENVKDGFWLHELALNSTVLEKIVLENLHLTHMEHSHVEDLTLLAKSCCNSLKSLNIGRCYLSKLGDAFRYAVRLEHFGGRNWHEESQLVGFRFPPNMCSLKISDSAVTCSILHPFLNHIRKLKLPFGKCQCFLFKRCPNLEVLYTEDECEDRGLQVIGKYCKKLRKLNHDGPATHVGLIALAKGCTKLECLKVRLANISNEAIECLGMHLKNLRKFRMHLVKTGETTHGPLDNGIGAMLMDCNQLESLDISLWHGGLTDVGLEYIGKYGRNLRFLSLIRMGKSDAGLVKLSEGCPNLRKLKLIDCPFSKKAVTSVVFNMPSLRYVWLHSSDRIVLALTCPEFQL